MTQIILVNGKLVHVLYSATDIADHAEEIDLDYLIEDLPEMIDSMKLGCDRINSISTSLRTCSRVDRNYQITANLHEGIIARF